MTQISGTSEVPSPASDPSSEEVRGQEAKKSLRLQDLLQTQAETPLKPEVSAITPQAASFEDRFAFDGLDVRILPKIKQKLDSSKDALDENGQTLA